MTAAERVHERPDLGEVQRAIARRSLIDFCTYTDPVFQRGWFVDDVAEKLDRFIDRVIAKESPRLMLFAPPQHGKSEMVSRKLPAYAVGRLPDLRIGAASYAAPLAESMSQDVEAITQADEYQEVFPGGGFPSKDRPNPLGKINRLDRRQILNGSGVYHAVGVGGPLTGRPLDVGIVDDPFKDAREALSGTIRETVWNWYRAVLRVRLQKGGGLIVMHTRWHVDDLAGRLLKAAEQDGEPWEVISYRAIDEEDTRRAPEDEGALCPFRFARKDLNAIKATVGSYWWSALYDQDPIVEGGDVFESDWWEFYKVVPKLRWMAIYADTASKTAERHDYSVFQAWGMGTDGRIYLLDQIRDKWKAPELRRRAIAFWLKWSKPRPDSVICRSLNIEDKSSGTGLIQELRVAKVGAERIAIPVRGIPRHVDKAVRASDGSPQIEAGNVVLPESAPWLSDYLGEFEAFTLDGSHAHDDQIDPTLDAIANMLGGAGDLYAGAL